MSCMRENKVRIDPDKIYRQANFNAKRETQHIVVYNGKKRLIIRL